MVYNLYRDIIFIKKRKKTRIFLVRISPSNTKFLSNTTREGKGGSLRG